MQNGSLKHQQHCQHLHTATTQQQNQLQQQNNPYWKKIPYYTNELDGLPSKQIGQLIHVQFSGTSRYLPLLQLEYSTDLNEVRLWCGGMK
jgi:hypothetical protein